MGLRLPGGGKKMPKQLTYRHMKEIIQHQQVVINALCEKLETGRKLVQEIIESGQTSTRIITPASVPSMPSVPQFIAGK